MPALETHVSRVEELDVFWRSDEWSGTPTLYVHGVPTSSSDFVPFLAAAGGIAVDLPGFGRSAKPAGRAYVIAEYDLFLERFLDALALERVNLVVHDWGAAALAFAQRRPERIGRLVVINAVPLLPRYSWHPIAKLWRTPLVGEAMMALTTRSTARLLTRPANVTAGPLPDAWIDETLATLDEGTKRAILRLYRSSPADVLTAAGRRLATIDAPALVAWGARDPFIGLEFAYAYANALHAELEILPDAGHWPWLDDPELVERITGFLGAG